jgi:hypothetical protein
MAWSSFPCRDLFLAESRGSAVKKVAHDGLFSTLYRNLNGFGYPDDRLKVGAPRGVSCLYILIGEYCGILGPEYVACYVCHRCIKNI